MISAGLSNIASNLIDQRKDARRGDFSEVEKVGNDIVYRSGQYDIGITDIHSGRQKTWVELETNEKVLLAQAISGQTAFNWLFDTLTAFLHDDQASSMVIFTPPNDVSNTVINPLLRLFRSSKRPGINLSYNMISRTVTVKTSCQYVCQRTIDFEKGTNKDEELSLPLSGSYTYVDKGGEFTDISIECDLKQLSLSGLVVPESITEDSLIMHRATLTKLITISIDASKKISDIKTTLNPRYPECIAKNFLDFFDSVLRMINGMMDKWDATAQDDATEDNFKAVIAHYGVIYTQLKATYGEQSTSEISLIQLYAQQLFDAFSDLEHKKISTLTSQLNPIIKLIRRCTDGEREITRLKLSGLSLFQAPDNITDTDQLGKRRSSCCCFWPFS